MKKEVVQYENKLNDYSLSGFHAIDLDLFMLICSKTKDNQDKLLSFSFVDLKKAVGLTNKTDKEFLKHLNQMAAKVKKIGGSFKKDDQFFEFNLFSDFYGTLIDVTPDNEDTREAYSVYGEVPKNTLLVSVNKRYAFLLNEMKQYTKFDLSEFVQLESKYSKNLYRLLKQFRSRGVYKVGAEKFRNLMGCPKSYPNKEFMRVCVNVAIKELSQGYFDNLKVVPVKGSGRGNPIISYEFSFRPSKDIPGQLNLDTTADADQGQPVQKKEPQPKKTRFHNLEERDYISDDRKMADLERQLLQGDIPPMEKPQPTTSIPQRKEPQPEAKVLTIRKGINGFAFAVCDESGHWLMNADSVEQIREHYKVEIKRKLIRLKKETRLYPVDADQGGR